MGAERARRWKLFPSFRSLSLPPASPSKPKRRPPPPPDAPLPPSSPAARKEVKEKEPEEEVPAEFLCPILRAPMADPVILPSGRTYERACVRACADLGLSLAAEGNAPGGGGADGGVAVAIPNDALRAAVRTWCARSGRAPPVPPSDETAREAVLRAVPRPPERAASNLSSCSSEPALAPARSASNLSSCSSEAASTSSSSSSSGRSSREMAAGEVEVARGKAAAKDKEEEPPARVADAEEDAVVRAVEAGHEAEVLEAAMSALRRATRESPARRRALCASPRLLASLRRVLLSSSRRHTPSARADAAAALANLTLEPENRVPLVRAGAVPALVDAVASSSSAAAASSPEAREHAAGALFGLALHEGNRAAIGVLGAVPPLLAVLSDHELATRARRDAGMALYHLSLAAVNQSKLARAPGASRSLLAVASEAGESALIRRLALMVACNVAGCAEGRAALMDAGAVAAASAILSAGDGSELKEWCVAAMYAMSKGSQRFRGVARAAGADRPLMLFAEQASPGVHKEMAQAALRTVLGLADKSEDDDEITECRNSEGNRGGGGRVPQRRRVASWSAAPPPATPASSHQWRSVCID